MGFNVSIGAVVEMGILSTLKRLPMESSVCPALQKTLKSTTEYISNMSNTKLPVLHTVHN
jgi:hypothetical protein